MICSFHFLSPSCCFKASHFSFAALRADGQVVIWGSTGNAAVRAWSPDRTEAEIYETLGDQAVHPQSVGEGTVHLDVFFEIDNIIKDFKCLPLYLFTSGWAIYGYAVDSG